MKIEREVIQFGPLNLEQVRLNGTILGMKQKQTFQMNDLQIDMLSMLYQGKTIEAVVQTFLLKRILISFISLAALIEFLVQEGLILNPGFHSYFAEMKEEKSHGLVDKMKAIFKNEQVPPEQIQNELKNLPFLRSLDPAILKVFMDQMRVIQSPPGIAVCQQGQLQRSLFVLMKGQCAVLKKKNETAKPKRVATLTEGSIFGEVGFFLGEPRTADVVTETNCQIIRLKYQNEVFDKLIQKETARNLQKRFWVIHSLLKSKTFQGIPDDCFDALVFAGNLKTIPPETTVFKQGDNGDSCCVVVQGQVVVIKDNQAVRVIGQGDSFGEVALMLNQGKRSATIKTQTETVVLEIPFDRFYQLLAHNLMLACEFEKIALGYLQSDHQR